MSAAPTIKAIPTKPKKDRERDKEKERKEKAPQPVSERLKTVVRRLPPNLPEDVFWKSVEAWISDETVTWKTYNSGKFRRRLNKENIPSRAYIAFKNEEQLAQFSREYDGHMFRDKAGNEAQAVVEFAPYQKIPTEKKKPDARNATIEKDEDYISFLNSINAAANAEPASLESLIAASQPPAPPKTTPLLEALKAEKSAHRDKEAILRNHSHYKDQTNLGYGGTPRKDDQKKKGAAGSQKPADLASGGKKPPKKAAPAATPQKPSPVKTNSTAGLPNLPPKSPKALRASRLPAQARAAAGVATSATPAPISNLVPSTSDVPPAPSSNTAPAPARRARPVIGIASRQFEAALSGVNGTSTELKSRREREREREKEREKAGGGATGAPPASPGGGMAEKDKSVPSSPRKDRGGRQKVIGGVAPMKVPSILQRADGPSASVPKDGPRVVEGGGDGAQPASVHGAAPPNPSMPGGVRGGRRGRGRGRGGNPGPTRG